MLRNLVLFAMAAFVLLVLIEVDAVMLGAMAFVFAAAYLLAVWGE